LSLDGFIQRLPKAELHVHLEGAIRPSTLLTLAGRHDVELPASDLDGLRRWFRFRDFDHFVEIYLTVSRCLRDPEDFALLATDFLAGQARQNVTYSEAHFTISTHAANGADPGEVLDALAGAIAQGERRFGARLRLIPDIVRNVAVEAADLTLEWALGARDRGVAVALGLSGFERYSDQPFAAHFAEAERRGLRRVAHAGEHAGPESIRSALEVARAERIGHGVRAVEDPALVAELAARGVPVEVCPSSNLCLGVFPSLAEHSFDRLYRAGVRVSVNSDDPPFFDTTLTDEYRRLAGAFGYGAAELAGLAEAAFAQSFLPPGEAAERRRDLRRQAAALGEELLGAPVVPVLPSGEPPVSP
jgi:adenosine deaminase